MAYPTHVIINENGTIEKVFGKASQMIVYLEDYKPISKSFKNKTSKNLIPPPPPPM
ncbi:hypothetical protein [Winogradskyella sp. UBA3174]|uniref:hypothetical protein n=1 Tax=Winogradskyella sp. UBA3174 TaxID=1947785 RepID=UPI0025EAC517|nr:hypothetical protein [Winogradskyella sp. UBA3174]|tara:strand:+ start:60419 stop:60586 length:168 start_codon:yes stop_codon:yes gene_type:complete